jgi:hypothetical protein
MDGEILDTQFDILAGMAPLLAFQQSVSQSVGCHVHPQVCENLPNSLAVFCRTEMERRGNSDPSPQAISLRARPGEHSGQLMLAASIIMLPVTVVLLLSPTNPAAAVLLLIEIPKETHLVVLAPGAAKARVVVRVRALSR